MEKLKSPAGAAGAIPSAKTPASAIVRAIFRLMMGTSSMEFSP
jgi:hypothetical protein